MKGDQIIHVFICEALVVLFVSVAGGMEAIWARMHHGFHVPIKALWPRVWRRCWPSCVRAELLPLHGCGQAACRAGSGTSPSVTDCFHLVEESVI